MALPFVLAGPIVRRVDARSASVWVATSSPTTVTLSVFPGVVSAGNGTDGTVFTGAGAVATGVMATVRVGSQLHVAVVTAEMSGNQPLLPGATFSYNLSFDRGTGGQPADLHSVGLLADRSIQPAIGYQSGVLPSFATCPASIDDLVLLHASCNRIGAQGGPNMFFAVDALIRTDRDDPRRRPHQLWLSGDQIYADEVPVLLSPWINLLARDLLAGTDELAPVTVAGTKLGIPIRNANLPGGYRASLMTGEAKLTTVEGASHLMGVGERAAFQLMAWSPEVWDRDTPDGAVFLPGIESVLPEQDPPLLDALEEHPGLTDIQVGEALIWLKANLTHLNAKEFNGARSKARIEREVLLAYASQVGRIRRALANVSTYFVFDDHDVTDDWNLCRLWRERVEGSDLGRGVVRDALTVYALFQGWGNDPMAWRTGPGRAVLDDAAQLFPEGAATGPNANAASELERRFGLGTGVTPDNADVLRWHYQIDGNAHRVITCDTRTRRGGSSPTSPPVQLPDGVREEQVPEGPRPAGIELVMVVLSQPLVDPVLLGELTQATLATVMGALADVDKKMTDLPKEQRHAIAGLGALDYEGWGAHPSEIARMLDRLSTYDRVLVLSGDVHFGISLGLQYWRANQGLVSTIGQFTSSAIQYITFPEILVPLLAQGWIADLLGRGYPFDYLLWRDPTSVPLAMPTPATRGLRRRLRTRPAIVPTRGWPEGTTIDIPPDAAWRIDLLRDERPVRPLPVRNASLGDAFDPDDPTRADFDPTDALRGPRGYAALARRHALGAGRRQAGAAGHHPNTKAIALYNKIARLTFAHDAEARLVATSELLAVDHHDDQPQEPSAFTVHRLVYDAPVATPRPDLVAPIVAPDPPPPDPVDGPDG